MGSSAQNGLDTRLRAARERLGWSREALAYHAGLSWSAIAQVESGRRTNVRPSTLASLAGALGVTIDYLVQGGRSGGPMLVHCAVLYDSADAFAESTAPFLNEAVERGEPALAVTSKANIELLADALGPAARQVQFANRRTWYRTPATALDSYREFLERKVRDGAPWVRIVGEPPCGPKTNGDARAWTRYEAMLNLAFASQPVSIMCPYDERVAGDELIGHVRATHPKTVDRGTFADSPDYGDPLDMVLEP